MNLTEISKIKSIIWSINIILKIKILLIMIPEDPNRVRSKCPAIMLAVNRIANVIGRIIKLIDSIKTMKGIKIVGVPWGVKWEKKSLIKCQILNSIIEIHIDSDSAKENLKCLEAVKIYGNKPIVLLIRINRNKLINIIKFDREYLRIILNSLIKNLKIIFHNIINREGINQYWNGKIKIISTILSQFIESFILEEGSKIENKFIIIFNFIY